MYSWKKKAAIHPSLYTKLMVGNRSRSLGTNCLSITQSGCAKAIIIKITELTKINITFLFASSPLSLSLHLSPVCLLFINDVYVSLADSYPQECITLSFWCSINHKQHQTKDIYSVGEGKRNRADIMSHSVWIQLKTVMQNEHIGGESLFLRLIVADRITGTRATLKSLLCMWKERRDRDIERLYEWLQIMRNFDQACFYRWHLKQKSVNLTALPSIPLLHSWLTKAHHVIPQRQVLFSFPVMIMAQSSSAAHRASLWRMKTDASMD